jgi:hypothetical protein
MAPLSKKQRRLFVGGTTLLLKGKVMNESDKSSKSAARTIALRNIKTTTITPDYTGIALNGEDADGTALSVTLDAGNIPALMDALSMAHFSINKHRYNALSFVETTDAQVHSLGPRVGLEVAFGKHGILHFELELQTAEKLKDLLERDIERIHRESKPHASN